MGLLKSFVQQLELFHVANFFQSVPQFGPWLNLHPKAYQRIQARKVRDKETHRGSRAGHYHRKLNRLTERIASAKSVAQPTPSTWITRPTGWS